MRRLTGVALVVCSGCASILGLDDFTDQTPGSGGSGGSSSSTSSATSSASASASASSGAGGSGGMGGTNAGGGGSGGVMMVCTPDLVVPCPYSGNQQMDGTGICIHGNKTCAHDGSGYSACTGEVLPNPGGEICGNGKDDDCNGMSDDGCMCTMGMDYPCYTGPGMTDQHLPCHDGTYTCIDGKSFTPCMGDVVPQPTDDCATPIDENCDGVVNEVGSGCVCTVGTNQACYTGSMQTRNVGACHDGTQPCAVDGKSWGACTGDQLPAATDDCSNSIDEDCTGSYCTQCLWSKDHGGGAADAAVIVDVAANAAGESYATGIFSGTLLFSAPTLISAGAFDSFLAKFDASGNVVWNFSFGDLYNQFAYGVALDSMGNVIVVGYFQRSITFGNITLGGIVNDNDAFYIAKLDPNNNALWAKAYGIPSSAPQRAFGVAVDKNDNIIVAGQFGGVCDFGGTMMTAKGATDGFLYKVDKMGNTVWVKQYWGGASDNVVLNRVAVDPAGNMAAVGNFTGTVNFGLASPIAANASGPDAIVMRVTAAGSTSFAKSFGNAKKIAFNDVKMDSLGNTVFVGAFQGTINVSGKMMTVPHAGSNTFVAQLGVAGTGNYAKQYGNTVINANGSSNLLRVALDSSDNVLLSGECYDVFNVGTSLSCSPTLSTPMLIETDGAGTLKWARAYGPGTGYINAQAFISPSFAILGASNKGNLDLGNGPLPAVSTNDTVMAEIATQ